MEARVKAEWDPLRTVAVHRPGIEMFFGLLEPYAALYERAFSQYAARNEHDRLSSTLHDEFGVEIVPLKQTILDAADARPAVRERLVETAQEVLRFSGSEEEVRLARQACRRNTDILDAGYYFTVLLLQPEVVLEPRTAPRAINVSIIERQPLANLYFMRDQQAVTDRGIVLSRMAKRQREREPELTALLFEVLGTNVVQRIEAPGTFEGGDFIPMDKFALVGIGDRTNQAGVEQLMQSALGFDEVGVVHQPGHPLIPGESRDPMIDMHLDTYFNVAGSGIAIGSTLLMERAAVDIYQREGDGTYRRAEGETNLLAYIREKGFEVIDLTTLEQMAYAPNFLCIRDGVIVAVEVDHTVRNVLDTLAARASLEPARYGRLLEQARKEYRDLKNEGQFFPHKKEVYRHDIDAYPLILENLTGGYGAAHCVTCALKRG